ncbi:hypothetical protein NNJEOMEG_02874 [Fundidesulfovibrio magnetotacticus]|uniref:Ferredoxin n=1 Tax=Fundidesulfovibrio magnetotacticus TaxID=2730080 RepID=A0A6V8LZ06_9BACT|nr:ASKHA domain-containing protein [Fundidesulfovibrio magnetotacticus]GFK95026.1 hypothetical protein NNJEOMEG_02874 [Fundidesulfovibrio magnetotacticus]
MPMNIFTIVDKAGGPDRPVSVSPGLTLAQHLYIEGAFDGRPLCSGAGRCGKCAVLFEPGAPAPELAEERVLEPERLEQGWRLSCARPPLPGARVRVRLAPERTPPPAPREVCPGAVLGVDLGTTSLHWRFERGDEALGRALPNPQLGAGSEVMSRLALARVPDGARRLRRAVVLAVREAVAALPCLPGGLCLAGNSCMTFLALGMDPSGLAAAPYRLDWPGGDFAELDPELPRVYIPPLLAPFVGGDVSAGLAALEFSGAAPRAPLLLADLGTNGEFALTLPDGRVLVASVPMGPALEGVGMSRGMLAGPGAAVSFALTPAGLAPRLYEGSAGPLRGVSGTGYVSLLARLRAMGAVEATGRFAREAASPLAARALAGLRREADGAPVLDVAGVPLHGSDVEALLAVKAAFESAVGILLETAGLRFADLHEVLLAGALGEHVSPADLETLGFFPPGGSARVRAAGNTSLAGACLAAGRADVREWLAGLPGRTRPVDVVSSGGFQRRYLDAMRFDHAR